MHVSTLLLLAAVGAAEVPAAAPADVPAEAGAPGRKKKFHALRFDARVDVPVGAALGAVGVSLVAFRPWLARSECQQSCTPETLNGLDASVRSALRWKDPDTARRLGDAVGYGLLPALVVSSGAVGLGEGQTVGEVLEDTWIIGEAFALSHALEGVIKLTSGRARPDTTFMPAGTEVEDPSDLHTSMVSGHATAGFAVAVSTGVVAFLRGRPSAPWLLLSGLTVATVSSYLRIAADRHYLTDVLAGAALGTAVGLAVPLAFHGRQAPVTLAPTVSRHGGALVVSGAF